MDVNSTARRWVSIVVLLSVLSVGIIAVSGIAVADGGVNSSAQDISTSCGAGETEVTGTAKFAIDPSLWPDEYSGSYQDAAGTKIEIVEVREDGPNETVGVENIGTNGKFSICVDQREDGNVRSVFVRYLPTGEWGGVYIDFDPNKETNSLAQGTSSIYRFESGTDTAELGDSPGPFSDQIVLPQSNHTAIHLARLMSSNLEYVRNETAVRPEPISVGLAPSTTYATYKRYGYRVNINPVSDYAKSSEVIYHEYGHHLLFAESVYSDDVPGDPSTVDLVNSCHDSGTHSNAEFAFSEGWAEYYAAYLGSYSDSDSPTNYHEKESGPCPPYGESGVMDGHIVEGQVTDILYTLSSEDNEETGIYVSFSEIVATISEVEPFSIRDLHEPLREEVENKTAYDRVYTRRGVDVFPPEIEIEGGTSQTARGGDQPLRATISDEHANVSVVEVRVNDGNWTSVEDWSGTGTLATINSTVETITVKASDPWGNTASRNVTVDSSEVPSFVDGQPVRDLDGDGLYEDVNGDGSADLFDALTYYNNRETSAIANNPSLFDFNDDGEAGTLFDALALYNRFAS